MALEKYNEKRDFQKTAEPEGKVQSSEGGLRFVVQLHDASRLHYDFRLEWNGVLLSWAVPKGPSFNPKERRLAVHVEDHPLDYRTFEGTIPKGEYGGGTVMVWDEGTWDPQGDTDEGMKSGSLKFTLHGERLQGRWTLVRMRPKPGEEDKNWLLIKEKDDYAKSKTGIAEFDTSIVTGRTLEEITRDAEAEEAEETDDDMSAPEPGQVAEDEPIEETETAALAEKDLLAGKLPFSETELVFAKTAERAPRGSEWIHEIKFDGYRLLCYLEDGEPRLVTRSGLDWTAKFPVITEALKEWNPGNIIMDGEVVALDENGESDFQSLQAAMKDPKDAEMHYIVFDLLALGSTDIRDEPLLTRKALLKELTKTASAEILYNFHQVGHGKAIFDDACAKGQEGIISKRANSTYRGGRTGDWLKVKCEVRQEFVIGGYTTTDKSATGLSALLLGVHNEDGLQYVGRAGTGFTGESARELLKKFARLERKTSPFTKDVDERSNETITYVTPSLVAEIRYAEMTNDGLLRQASYKGLREDKPAEEVVLETAVEDEPEEKTESAESAKSEGPNIYGDIKLSSPDKIMYPKDSITKKDIADYYWAIRDQILVQAADRPMTLIRCTDGIEGECFYQKHMNQDIPGMDGFSFKEKDGDEAVAMVIRDASGLMGAVQMGAVEFHSWGSTTENLEKPNMMVFDLDPDEGMGIEDVRRGVTDLRKILSDIGLTSYLKTSGGKGYHVVVPLNPVAEWEKVRAFAKRIAQTMEKMSPSDYTSNMRKAKRKGRIFIDWVRNGRGATSVCNFSLRSRAGAPIAWPLRWSDLDKVLPNTVTLKNYQDYMETVEGWKDFAEQDQGLK